MSESVLISSGNIPVPEEILDFLRCVMGRLLDDDAHEAVKSIGIFTPSKGIPHTEQDRIASVMFKDVVLDFFPGSGTPPTRLKEGELWVEPGLDMGKFFQRCGVAHWTNGHGRSRGPGVAVDCRITFRNGTARWGEVFAPTSEATCRRP